MVKYNIYSKTIVPCGQNFSFTSLLRMPKLGIDAEEKRKTNHIITGFEF